MSLGRNPMILRFIPEPIPPASRFTRRHPVEPTNRLPSGNRCVSTPYLLVTSPLHAIPPPVDRRQRALNWYPVIREIDMEVLENPSRQNSRARSDEYKWQHHDNLIVHPLSFPLCPSCFSRVTWIWIQTHCMVQTK